MLAQQLYEGLDIGEHGHVGLITYMRTDSVRINDDMVQNARDFITATYGKEYIPAKAHVYKAKQSSQDAHEAIRPTSLELTPDKVAPYLSRDQLRLYTLIWNRFLASQMAPVETEHMAIVIMSGPYELRAAGYTVLFKGFTELYEDTKKIRLFPYFRLLKPARSSTTRLSIRSSILLQPPARYTEASLIKTLEEKGIGRPSTYAPGLWIPSRTQLCRKKDKQFVPTELGVIIVDLLKKFFERIINVSFTAHMEEETGCHRTRKGHLCPRPERIYDVFEPEMEAGREGMEKSP